jgi:hypothetical protein
MVIKGASPPITQCYMFGCIKILLYRARPFSSTDADRHTINIDGACVTLCPLLTARVLTAIERSPIAAKPCSSRRTQKTSAPINIDVFRSPRLPRMVPDPSPRDRLSIYPIG